MATTASKEVCNDCGGRPADLGDDSIRAARPLIASARISFQRGELITTGCLLREAINRFLAAVTEQYEIRQPTVNRNGKPVRAIWNTTEKLRALRRAKILCACDHNWMKEVLEHCHRLAHCDEVSPGRVETCLCVTAAMISPDLIAEWNDAEGGAI